MVLKPIIKLSVKSMASIGTQKFRNRIDFDEKLVKIVHVDIANETLLYVVCTYIVQFTQ